MGYQEMEHQSQIDFMQEMKLRRLKKRWSQDNLGDELGVSNGLVSRWESGGKQPGVRKIGLISKLLDMDEAITDAYFAYRANIDAAPYIYGSLAEHCRRGYNQEDILDGAFQIYKQLPEPVIPEHIEGSNDYGSDEKWDRLQKAFPETFFAVLSNKQKKVEGYFHLLSLTDEAYESGVKGENINKQLTSADCRGFLIPERHNLYIVDFFQDKYARDPVINEIMLNMFTSFLLSLANTGHEIRRMMTNASEHEAINYCDSLDFNKTCDHLYHRMYDPDAENKYPPTEIWELDFDKCPDSKLFEIRPALRKLVSS
jgi:transcriptional regulator with XRE-family HTH domain